MITSRKYSDQELHDLITGKNIRNYKIAFVPEKEDYEYEDTAMVAISLPRGMWKIAYAASEANKCSIGEMISDFTCNAIWELMRQMVADMIRDGIIPPIKGV